jgi:hypothetical protein
VNIESGGRDGGSAARRRSAAKTLPPAATYQPGAAFLRASVLLRAGAFLPVAHVWTRPRDCPRLGLCTDATIGQDFGDVFALLAEGYGFDGIQSAPVSRLGDDAGAARHLSIPGFHGTHGHDSRLPSMSAVLYAAGPRIRKGATLPEARTIDVVPTIPRLLGVEADLRVEGRVLEGLLDHR